MIETFLHSLSKSELGGAFHTSQFRLSIFQVLNIHTGVEAGKLERAYEKAQKWGETPPKRFPAVGGSPTLLCQSPFRKAQLLSPQGQQWAALENVLCRPGTQPGERQRLPSGSCGPHPGRGVLCGSHSVCKSLEVAVVFVTLHFSFLAPADIGACNPCIRPQFLKSGRPGC